MSTKRIPISLVVFLISINACTTFTERAGNPTEVPLLTETVAREIVIDNLGKEWVDRPWLYRESCTSMLGERVYYSLNELKSSVEESGDLSVYPAWQNEATAFLSGFFLVTAPVAICNFAGIVWHLHDKERATEVQSALIALGVKNRL